MLALIDPLVVQGASAEARCRLCGRVERLGQVVRPGFRFTAPNQVLAGLTLWADEDGESDLVMFCASNMGGLSPASVAEKVLAGEPIDTSFDVVAFLFPGMAGGTSASVDINAPFVMPAPIGGSGLPAPERPPPLPVDARPPTPAPTRPLRALPPEALQPTVTRDPMACTAVAARALAAVMLADGIIRPGERRFLDRFLAESGLEPLKDDDIRPWRPGDLARPADPGPILDAMSRLAHIDRERDGSEWRVVREFARYWGHPLAELEAEGLKMEEATAPAVTRLWRSLRSLIVSENQ